MRFERPLSVGEYMMYVKVLTLTPATVLSENAAMALPREC